MITESNQLQGIDEIISNNNDLINLDQNTENTNKNTIIKEENKKFVEEIIPENENENENENEEEIEIREDEINTMVPMRKQIEILRKNRENIKKGENDKNKKSIKKNEIKKEEKEKEKYLKIR